MPLRPRTLRRLGLLAGVSAVALVCWWAVSHYLAEADARRRVLVREEGLSAWHSGDWSHAVRRLDDYFAFAGRRDDAEARLAYVLSLAHDADPFPVLALKSRGFGVLPRVALAATLADELLSDRADTPDRLELRHARLLTLAAAGRYDALRDAADAVLEDHPADATALRALIVAAEAAGDTSTATGTARRLHRLFPGDPDVLQTRFRLETTADRPASTLIAYAIDLENEVSPDAGQHLLVLAHAYNLAGQQEQALACLDQAAGRLLMAWADAATDLVMLARVLDHLIDGFDRVGMPGRVLPLLEDLYDVSPPQRRNAVDVCRVVRHLQSGEVALAADVAETSGLPADPRLAGWALLAAVEAGRLKSADALQRLDAAADPVAGVRVRLADEPGGRVRLRLNRTWRDAIDAIHTPGLSVTARRELLLRAVRRVEPLLPDDAPASASNPTPWLHYHVGRTYADVGEDDWAAVWFESSAAALPAWPDPLVALAELHVSAGRGAEAEAAAGRAVRRASHVTPGKYARATGMTARAVWVASLNPDRGLRRPQRLVAEHQAEFPFHETTLALHVHTLAETDPPSAVAWLERLDAAGVASPACADAAAAALASGNPDVVAAADRVLATTGFADAVDAGLRWRLNRSQLRRLGERGQTTTATGGRARDALARARLAEALGDPSAAATWKSAVESFPDDVHVLRGALREAASLGPDAQTLSRAVVRLRTAAGPETVQWQISRAEILSKSPDQADLLLALLMLQDVLTGPPIGLPGVESRRPDARLLLAETLAAAGNLSAAADHLEVAFEEEPARAEIGLRRIAMLERQGRRDEARRILDRLTGEPLQGAAYRVEVADRLHARGQTAAAVNLLVSGLSEAGESVQVRTAQLLARSGDAEEAAKHFEALLADVRPAAATLLSAAVFAYDYGLTDEPEAILRRLHLTGLPEREIQVVRGAYFTRIGRFDHARDAFDVALAETPGHLSPWLEALDSTLKAGDTGRASNLLRRCIVYTGDAGADDLRLTWVGIRIRAMQAGSEAEAFDVVATSLGDVMTRRATQLPATLPGTLRGLAKGEPIRAEDVPALDRLADHLPCFLGLHRRLSAWYAEQSEPEEALRVARLAAEANPRDAEAQRLAYVLSRDAGLGHDMLYYALRWATRFDGDAVWADTAVADALLAVGRPEEASDLVLPHLDRLHRLPTGQEHLLWVAAEALAATARYREAYELIGGYFSGSAGWRAVAIDLAAERLTDLAEARVWLRAVTSAAADDRDVTSDAADEEALLRAAAWIRLGVRLNDPSAVAVGREALVGLSAGTKRQDARLWMTLARSWLIDVARQDAGDAAAKAAREAEAALRRVLVLNPRHAEAGNELAFLLLEYRHRPVSAAGPEYRDASEAIVWSTLAVTESPAVAEYHDTHARVLDATGDVAGATLAFERALRLDPGHAGAGIGLALLEARGDEPGSAGERLERVVAGADVAGWPPHLRRDVATLNTLLGRGAAADGNTP